MSRCDAIVGTVVVLENGKPVEIPYEPNATWSARLQRDVHERHVRGLGLHCRIHPARVLAMRAVLPAVEYAAAFVYEIVHAPETLPHPNGWAWQ